MPETFQQGPNLFWYALGMIFLFETASTVMNTNYEALFPELFQAFRERTRASAYKHGLGMIGELVGFSWTPIIYIKFGFVGMAVFFAIGTGILLTISILGNSEDPSAQKAPPLSLKTAFREVLQDRPFWQFTIVATLIWFTTGVYTLATPFYARTPWRPVHKRRPSFLARSLSSPLPWSRSGASWCANGASSAPGCGPLG